MRTALLAALLSAAPAAAEPVALAARLDVGGLSVVVGRPAGEAMRYFDCPASAAQCTVLRCRLTPEGAAAASALGFPVAGATLNVHFQGDVQNMAIDFGGLDAGALLARLRSALAPREPTLQHWADDERLYESSIWVEDGAEAEVTRTLRGEGGAGGARLYASSLAGGRPVCPGDLAR